LSPITNKRKDIYGSSLENRAKIHSEICRKIREKVGENFPIIIKLGLQDAFLNEGLTFLEGKKLAILMESFGFDAIEISQGLQDFNSWDGTPMRMVNKIEDEAYFRKWSREIKKEVKIPVILTGGLKSYEIIDEIIRNKEADFVGLCRPLIREENLVNRWQMGDCEKAKCTSCKMCITELLMQGKPLECYVNKK